MTSSRQLVLTELDVDAATAIKLAQLIPLSRGDKQQRTASVRSQKRVLQFFAGFANDKCWLSIEGIATRLQMNERTVRLTIRVLVDADLIIESGHHNRRTRAVHWTEIGRRVHSPAVPQPPRMKTERATDTPGTSARSENVVLPGPTGQYDPNCPVQTGHQCPPRPGTDARTYQEQVNNLSSSIGKPVDDDDEIGCQNGWDIATTKAMETTLKAANVGAWFEAIENAKAAGVTPPELADALFVAMNYRDPSTGEKPLTQRGFVSWTRNRVWPCDGVPTASELRKTSLSVENTHTSRCNAASDYREAQRCKAADVIRMGVIRDARKKPGAMPPDSHLLAINARRLNAEGYSDLITEPERNALATLERLKSERQAKAGHQMHASRVAVAIDDTQSELAF